MGRRLLLGREGWGLAGPYTEAQVIGCVLTSGLVTAVLSARLNPVLVTFGMAGGFWTAWTVQAVDTDETGLFLVGSILLGLALLVGGAVASASGRGAHVLWQRARSEGRRA